MSCLKIAGVLEREFNMRVCEFKGICRESAQCVATALKRTKNAKTGFIG